MTLQTGPTRKRLSFMLRLSSLVHRNARHFLSASASFPRSNSILYRAMSSKHQTLTEAVKEDHQEMYEYHDEYKKAAGDPDTQARWARQLTWEIARHAVGEEIVIYPLMEKYMGAEGKRLADGDREEHQFVKEKLYNLESLTAGTAEYDKTITQVMEHLHKHNDSEEINDLPQLEPLLGVDGSREAATSFTRTKKFAPTRTHPSAPNHPPAETLVSFLELPIDRLKDLFAKFPTEEMKAGKE